MKETEKIEEDDIDYDDIDFDLEDYTPNFNLEKSYPKKDEKWRHLFI